MACWDTFESRWEITATLVAKTGLRVGSGNEGAEPIDADLPVLTDSAGAPYIPGSSLRGVMRSHIERIVRALEKSAKDSMGACNPVEEKEWCITAEKMRRLRDRTEARDHSWFAKEVWNRSCRVCRLFGSPWLASRVRLEDLRTRDEASVEVRDGIAIDRDKETVEHKFDFEVVPAETRFQLSVTADNLDEKERGLLWLALRELERGHIRLGGFKGRGLGKVALEDLVIRGMIISDRQVFRAYLLKGLLPKVEPSEADNWIDQALDDMMEKRDA